METEYVSFNPPRTTAVKMTRGPWFLDCFAGSWHFDEVDPSHTRVSFRYNIQAWPRWLAWFLVPILARFFSCDTRQRLRGLKDAVELRGILGGRADGACSTLELEPRGDASRRTLRSQPPIA